MVALRGVCRLVELSHPVVEAGIFVSPKGTALVLANFTYEPIQGLEVDEIRYEEVTDGPFVLDRVFPAPATQMPPRSAS